MNHLTDEQLAARLDGALTGRALEEADRHLASCAQCRDALAVLTTQDEGLAAALAHDPGEAYFATFPARVEDRLRAAGLRGAQKRMRDEGWMGWWTAPRRLAWTAAVAAVVAGAGVVLLTTRDERLPAAGDRAIERRLAQQENVAPPTGQATPTQPPPRAGASGPAASSNRADAQFQKKEMAAPSHAVPSGPLDAVGPGGSHGAAPARMREVGNERATSPVEPNGPTATAIPAPGGGVRVGRGRTAQPMTTQPAAPPPAPEASAMRAEPAPAIEEQAQQKTSADAPRPTTTGGATPSLAQGFTTQSARDAQDVALCGHVLDPEGHAVARAVVTVVALGRSAHSGEQGDFCIDAPPGSYELSVLAVGFEPARMQVRVGGERSDVQVTLRAISVLDGKASAPAMKMQVSGDGAKATPALKDPFAGEAPDVATRVQLAQAATVSATKSATQASWEKAVGQWNEVLGAVKTPAARSEARYRLAEALVGAWRHSSGSAILQKQAITACTAVLAGTPTTQQRADVTRWMSQLRATGH